MLRTKGVGAWPKKTFVHVLMMALVAMSLCLSGCSAKVDLVNVFDEMSNGDLSLFKDDEGSFVRGSAYDGGLESKLVWIDGEEPQDDWWLKIDFEDEGNSLFLYTRERYSSEGSVELVVTQKASYSSKLKRLVVSEPLVTIVSPFGPVDSEKGWVRSVDIWFRDIDYDQVADVLAEFDVSLEDVERTRRSFVGVFVSAYLDEAGGQSAYSEDNWGEYETLVVQ